MRVRARSAIPRAHDHRGGWYRLAARARTSHVSASHGAGTHLRMPNWCHNRLVVRGPDAAVRDFAECARGARCDGGEQPILFARHAPVAYDREPAGPAAAIVKEVYAPDDAPRRRW